MRSPGLTAGSLSWSDLLRFVRKARTGRAQVFEDSMTPAVSLPDELAAVGERAIAIVNFVEASHNTAAMRDVISANEAEQAVEWIGEIAIGFRSEEPLGNGAVVRATMLASLKLGQYENAGVARSSGHHFALDLGRTLVRIVEETVGEVIDAKKFRKHWLTIQDKILAVKWRLIDFRGLETRIMCESYAAEEFFLGSNDRPQPADDGIVQVADLVRVLGKSDGYLRNVLKGMGDGSGKYPYLAARQRCIEKNVQGADARLPESFCEFRDVLTKCLSRD
jgi:hypothetical protein